ncbi:gluconokinase [Mesorhizobium sp. NZP2298]|nr:gluconokinase [Mesorhizobium sp. NZP2298]
MAAFRSRSEPALAVVMGVSGSGKTRVGAALAQHLGVGFLEGDSLHPASNIDKMSRGVPLTDEDRWPWLDRIGDALRDAARQGEGLIVSCSALKRSYRERLRGDAEGLAFIHLTGSQTLLAERLASRTGHFMPARLLASQLATLESTRGELRTIDIDIGAAPEVLVAHAARFLKDIWAPAVVSARGKS